MLLTKRLFLILQSFHSLNMGEYRQNYIQFHALTFRRLETRIQNRENMDKYKQIIMTIDKLTLECFQFLLKV